MTDYQSPHVLTPERVLGQREKFLLYGDPGTGKTFLALTAPEPIYVLATGGENELKTRYSRQFMELYPERDIMFDVVKESRQERGEMTDNPTANDEVGDILYNFVNWDQESGRGTKTLVIDNATVLEEFQMNKAIAAEWAIASGGKDKQVLTRERKYGIRRPHDNTWGAAQSLMSKFIGWLWELDYHIVLVAHEYKDVVRKRNAEDSLEGVYPLFVGKQRTKIARAFDNVWRCTKSGGGRGVRFEVMTTGDDIYKCKTRVGGIFDDVEYVDKDFNLTTAVETLQRYPSELEKEKDNG